jgi:hypothetical protein
MDWSSIEKVITVMRARLPGLLLHHHPLHQEILNLNKMKTRLFSIITASALMLSLMSCSKLSSSSPPVEDTGQFVKKYESAYLESISARPESLALCISESEFTEIVKHHQENCGLWSEHHLRAILPINRSNSNDPESWRHRVDYLLLMASDQRNDPDHSTIETVITRTSGYQVNDANLEALAMVYASLGQFVGDNVSYDYNRYQGSKGYIGITDIFNANTAYRNASINDALAEVLPESISYEFQISGQEQTWLIAVDIVMGSSMEWTYWNSETNSTETMSIDAGDTLHFGSGTALGPLVINATMSNEPGELPGSFTDAIIYGPLPGNITSISILGGFIPQPVL